jgi:hypothetical protein
VHRGGIKWGAIVMSTTREPIAPARQKCVLCVLTATAMKSWRLPLAMVALTIAVGCAGPTRTGATFDTLTQTIKAPKAGNARVVVLRDKAFPGLFDIGWQVRLDGAPVGDLKTGTFVYRDRPAGSHKLTFERPGDLFRESHQEFAVASGRTYFFRLEMNEKGRLVMAASSQAGLAGLFISSAMSAAADERGLFDFTPLENAAASEALADLRLAE